MIHSVPAFQGIRVPVPMSTPWIQPKTVIVGCYVFSEGDRIRWTTPRGERFTGRIGYIHGGCRDEWVTANAHPDGHDPCVFMHIKLIWAERLE